MRYQQIIDEANDLGLAVHDRGEDVLFQGADHYARMFRVNSREWWGHSHNAKQQPMTIKGQKSRVADWCLTQAANGPA